MIPPGSAAADRHGTSVCSLIFGRGPVRGLAPGCSGLVLPLFFRDSNEGQSRPVSQLDLGRAIAFGLEGGVSIFNISAGQKSATTETESHLSQVIRQSIERRVLLVAAAGNDGCAFIHLPAGVEFVLSVGALGAAGRPLATSNWADVYRQNGLLAPGENLPVAIPGGGVSSGSGTSFAAAVVSAVAGLLLSVARREGYRLDPLDIRHILIDTAAPCELEGDGACDRYLAGTLDAAAALAMVHRMGTARGSFAALPTVGEQLLGTDKGHQQFTDLGMGGLVMSNLSSDAVEPSGLSPSACSCQQKPDEETLKATVQPQSAAWKSAAKSRAQSIATACAGSYRARCDALSTDRRPQLVNKPAHAVSGASPHPMQIRSPYIQPVGAFALQIYTAMLEAAEASLDEIHNREQRVSIPGLIAGSTRLFNGMTVPVVYPDLRGMYRWQSKHLIDAAKAAVGKEVASDDDLFNFLNRVYYELRNFGVAPQDRALNFAATNAYQAQRAFAETAGRNLALDTISVVKSPICRPDSDCWDVQLQMFDPENERRASRVYRYTVDVSEVLPVTVGEVRNWAVRA